MFGQSFGNIVQGLIPGGFLQGPVASDERSLQPFLAVDEVEAEFTLEAALAVVGRRVDLGHGTYNLAETVNFEI